MLSWQAKSRHRVERSARQATLVLTAISLCIITLSYHRDVPFIIYNPSLSAPIGYYRTLATRPLRHGDWVLLQAPEPVRSFAEARGYLPASVPMIKRVAALTGDRVCAVDARIYIDGILVATRLRRDHRGRFLPWWTGCYTLAHQQVFVLNTPAPSSFDGRYFGLVTQEAVRARLVKL